MINFAQVVVVALVGAKVPTMEDPVDKAVVGGVKRLIFFCHSYLSLKMLECKN